MATYSSALSEARRPVVRLTRWMPEHAQAAHAHIDPIVVSLRRLIESEPLADFPLSSHILQDNRKLWVVLTSP